MSNPTAAMVLILSERLQKMRDVLALDNDQGSGAMEEPATSGSRWSVQRGRPEGRGSERLEACVRESWECKRSRASAPAGDAVAKPRPGCARIDPLPLPPIGRDALSCPPPANEKPPLIPPPLSPSL
mmetsp:Transcript_24748/g.39767  ORF Transcript_24748/g.39767 Transcript_24748/m.39767 type:complete len:127 (+) Transcript_24748:2277-2657(+)